MQFVYRGEDNAHAGKPGRTPADVKKAGGFTPWQAKTVAEARKNLVTLVQAGTLAQQAQSWCLYKNKENGWFFSTGTDTQTAYDHYDFFYRLTTTGLQKVEWSVMGASVNVKGMSLYLNGTSLDNSTLIAVIWSVRPTELLVMTPVPVSAIEVKAANQWKPLSDY
ncbi:hypothetical protein [Burkholderia ubonensis]|uniref:hypothetical protein n=1 Tax=Burkholderia ubonensis TaxID=101571 RepID=UPI00075D1FC4|nr:hypothetical protein [Burkholderia ubonensis]AOK61283.1 hypothetical protein WM29_18955 [Burkholderia ubonensis]KVS44187.1 hypothetical protein WK37_15225 [Burkholderia ubonensis]KVS46824.1 hypothetical protein WK38_02315 [Burkholderia ubonensis]KVS79919.1 hypothetical protein WK44_31900 [Burkholderia ubonensis]KVS82881.1 hypothetical protein WK42_09935 [Burkholderia ubonensis]